MEDWQNKMKMYVGLYWHNKFKVARWIAIYSSVIVGIMIYQHNFPQPAPPPTPGMKMEERLGKEFSLLATLPGATQQNYAVFHKRNLAHIQGSYRTDKDYSEILAFYLEELKKNGWIFIKEDYISGDSSQHAMFCKNKSQKDSKYSYELHIYYFRREGLFTVDLTWRGD
jgi:hypothetical protein